MRNWIQSLFYSWIFMTFLRMKRSRKRKPWSSEKKHNLILKRLYYDSHSKLKNTFSTLRHVWTVMKWMSFARKWEKQFFVRGKQQTGHNKAPSHSSALGYLGQEPEFPQQKVTTDVARSWRKAHHPSLATLLQLQSPVLHCQLLQLPAVKKTKFSGRRERKLRVTCWDPSI